MSATFSEPVLKLMEKFPCLATKKNSKQFLILERLTFTGMGNIETFRVNTFTLQIVKIKAAIHADVIRK